jgi:hypothetical protein
VSQMKREPTEEERKKILRAIAPGDRIGATSMYISTIECGLTEAQEFIKGRAAELQAEKRIIVSNPETIKTDVSLGPHFSVGRAMLAPSIYDNQVPSPPSY